MSITDVEIGFDGIIKFVPSNPVFHQIIIREEIRDRLYFITMYLPYIFFPLVLKSYLTHYIALVFFSRAGYNTLILFGVVKFNAGFSDWLWLWCFGIYVFFETSKFLWSIKSFLPRR